MVVLEVLFIALLLFVAYQDFKSRAISFWTIPALFAIVVTIGLLQWPIWTYLLSTLLSISILLVNFILLYLYFAIKNRKFSSIINSKIGVGDILFILVLAFLFPPMEMLLFLAVSFLVILIVSLVVMVVSKNAQRLIPLAGGLSIALVLLWVYKLTVNPDILSIVTQRLVY